MSKTSRSSYDSLKFLKSKTEEVFFDAEHFFDGYNNNPEFSLKCLEAALEGGADCLVLCDTNGGSMPDDIEAVVTRVGQRFPEAAIGIHCHNDGDLAVANTLAALAGGCHPGARLHEWLWRTGREHQSHFPDRQPCPENGLFLPAARKA